MEKTLVYPPAVFAAENEYRIFIRVSTRCMCRVEVNGKSFYDDSNGILRSRGHIHTVTVPMKELDDAGEYTVYTRTVVKRLAYRSICRKPVGRTFIFHSLPEYGEISIYHIADTHGRTEGAIAAAKHSGMNIDLLVLNGDIIDASYSEKEFDVIYEICGAITGGSIPVIFSRGNHDLRGEAAEVLEKYSPVVNGKSYYTFRLGRVWGIILDCGEDKSDSNEEYGNTVCCEAFRKKETEFIKKVIASAGTEYEAPGVEYRLVVVHNPFCYISKAPFDIEKDTYTQWARLLGEYVKPTLMLCGHLHTTAVSEIGGAFDSLGQPCTVVIGADPGQSKLAGNVFEGCAVTLNDGSFSVKFTR